MERKNFFPIKLLSTAVVVSATIFSCTNNDTTDSSTTTDTTTVMSIDTSKNMMDTANTPDTATMPAVNTGGTAKPNPAKKGMKGKVTVVETTAPKSTGNMGADNTGV